MDVTFEYLLASIVIFLMIGTSVYMVTTITTTQLDLVTEQQLTPVAQQLMDKILLTSGSPSDWGYNIADSSANLTDFGIASSTPNVPLYEVDPAKMQKLVNNSATVINNLYISPTTAGTLLGIKTSTKWLYGFKLYIVPSLSIALNATSFPMTGSPTFPASFTFNISTADGVPAMSAAVELKLFEFVTTPSTGTPSNFTFYTSVASSVSNYTGAANFTLTAPPYSPSSNQNAIYLVAVQADYYGLLSTAFFQFPSPPGSYNAIIDGQFLLCSLLQPVTLPNATQGTGYNPMVIEITDNLNVVLNPATDVTSSGTYGYLLYTTPYTLKLYSMANAVSPDVIWGGLLAYPQSGTTFLLNATRPGLPVSVNYYTQPFASNLASAKLLTSVTVERYVHVDLSSYTVYLTVWSMGT